MRIALICTSFLPAVGGLEWKVHYLADAYARRGHDVTVFSGRPTVSLAPVRMPVVPNYRVVRCAAPIPGIGRLGAAQLLFCRAVLRHHRQRAFDVLHCHGLGPPTRYGVAVKRRTGVPVVATASGGDLQVLPEIGYGDRLKPRFDRMVRENLLVIDVVGAISRGIRREIERLGTTARIVDLPNGVPWDLFQTGPSDLLRRRMGLDESAVTILSVGRNLPVKGYDVGLQAFARVAADYPAAAYAIVGRNVPRLAGLVASLRLDGRVRLFDELPQAELPRVFHSADVFFNPSMMEGFSQVNAQALASGLPCVVTDAPGNADAGDGGGAIVARSGNIGSMAQALARLIADPQERRRMGRLAHEAGKGLSWEWIAGRYLEIFAQLSSRPEPTPRAGVGAP